MTKPRRQNRVLLIGFALVLTAIGACGLLWFGRSTNPLLEAESAYRKGDWDRAASRARDRLKSAKDDSEALRILARTAARTGRDDSALSLYRKRLKGEGMTTEDQYLLGLVMGRKGNADLAFKIWEHAANTPPDHAELLDGLARLSAQKNHIEEAAELAERLHRLEGWEARGSIMLGTFRSMMDDPSGAVGALEEGIKIDAEAGTAPFTPSQNVKLLARNFLRLGRPGEARRVLATKLSPSQNRAPEIDREACWLAGRADLQEGKTVEAAAWNAKAGEYRREHPLIPEPSPYVGSKRCESCHGTISKTYSKSRHARSFQRGAGLLSLPRPDHPLTDPDDPKVTHAFEQDGEQLRVLTRVDDTVYKLVVDFAFGTPERYLSMVGRDEEGAYRAVRLSYHHNGADSGWDRTAGDAGDMAGHSNVRGQNIDTRDGVVRCLGCHVTNARDYRSPEKGHVLQSQAAADSSIGCERCHGPGANHVAAAKTDMVHDTVVNVGPASAQLVSAQCSECHIVGDAGEIKKAPDDPRFVRSAGLTFTFSRCYTQSAGALSCLTCHDPHGDSSHDPAFYEAKCLQCHEAGDQSKTVCKVSPSKDCLGCHMPKLPMPVLHNRLTDHFIRVRPGVKSVSGDPVGAEIMPVP